MVTIIDQIKSLGSLKSRTTNFIKRMESVLSSSPGLIELDDVEVGRERMCDIAKERVNQLRSARCNICNSVHTVDNAWKQHCDNSENTLEQ
jgi:hypothetical protein